MRAFLILAAAVAFAAPASAQGMRAADANGDGAITRAEAVAAREAAFTAMDANGDGYVTAAERAAMSEGRGARRGGGQRMEAARAEMDADGDGRLSRAEFMNAPMPLFDRADTNGDDVLSAEELSAARQRLGALRAQRH